MNMANVTRDRSRALEIAVQINDSPWRNPLWTDNKADEAYTCVSNPRQQTYATYCCWSNFRLQIMRGGMRKPSSALKNAVQVRPLERVFSVFFYRIKFKSMQPTNVYI